MPSDIAHKTEVPGEFDRAAGNYDLLTGLNPGYHRHLRMSAARLDLARGGEGLRVLDLCCGTGLSTEALREVYPRAELTGLDASSGMLEVARRKSLLRGVRWVHGDASDPRAAGIAGTFDAVLMAYGLRNLPEPDRALANISGLLRPGAPICVHEYSVADDLSAQRVWDAVCLGIIVPSGLIAGGDSRIYRYLHQSVRSFDGVRALEARLRRAGFEEVRTEPMDGWQRGIVHSFLARAPSRAPDSAR